MANRTITIEIEVRSTDPSGAEREAKVIWEIEEKMSDVLIDLGYDDAEIASGHTHFTGIAGFDQSLEIDVNFKLSDLT